MNNAFKEAIKEFGRMAVLAVIPVLISSLEGSQINLRATGIALGIVLLRTLDRFIHEEKSLKSTGLVNMVTLGKVEL